MKTVSVEIVGTGRGYLQHRYDINPQITDRLLKRKSAVPNSVDDMLKEAEKGLYKNKKGEPYLPATHIEGCLVKAASNFQIPGRGKKTYKDAMMSLIMVEPAEIPIDPPEWEPNVQQARIQRQGIARSRPLFPPGWHAKFKILIMDDQVNEKAVKDILEYAGKYVGIGDYRPRFGQFEVEDFK